MFFPASIFLRAFIFCLFLTLLTACASTNTTPLTRAAGEGDLNTVRALLEKGVAVDEKNYMLGNELTALHWAAYNGRTDIVRILLEAGADMNFQDVVGYTPLHYGAYYNYQGVVSLLLDAGADPDVVSQFGTPMQVAQKRGHEEIVDILKGAGKKSYLNTDKTSKKPFVKAQLGEIQTSPHVIQVNVPAVASLDLGTYHALVIGNNEYHDIKKLHTAVSDAQAISALLQDKYRFQTRLLLNATRANILRAINDYRRRLGPRDNLIIYYAGHGWLDTDADQGYWLPVDATEKDPTNWISNGSITDALRAMEAKHVLVIADSCYSGKLSRGINVRVKTKNYYKKISEKKARTVMASGGLEPVADEGGKGAHSVFASALIEALDENQGVIDATSLFSQIRRPVMVNTDQTPEYSDIRKAGHDGGDFLFFRANKP